MKSALSLLALVLSFSAQAGEGKSKFDFTFFGNAGSTYSMVACSYAEPIVTEWMTKFGASDLEVYCSGGIQSTGVISPLSLRVKYVPTVVSREPTTATIEIESDGWNSNCDFDSKLMRALLRDFTNVKALRNSDGCFTPRDRYSYKLEVTTGK